MGFDLSGMNPKINTKPDEFPVYNKYSEMSFNEKWQELDADEKLKDKYWEEYNKYQDANPGIYFRNNVWWWRPLWGFVCDEFPDLLDDNDVERGEYNEGHEITEDKAMKIGIGLTAMLESGEIKEYADSHREYVEQLDDDDFNKHYPFDVENVREFAEFCLESGGFAIC